MKVLRWIGALVSIQGFVLGLILAIDQLTDDSVRTWIRERGWDTQIPLLIALYFLIPIVFFLVFVLPLVLKRREHIAWKRWCSTFSFAGACCELNISAVCPNRRMDLPYVNLKRELQHPLHLRTSETSPKATDDAETHLADLVGKLEWQQTHYGFLLEAPPLVGKTRLVAEWLRKHRPDALLLVPDPSGSALTPPLSRLHRLRQVGICLFLDDLDSYSTMALQIQQFLKALGNWGIPFLVAATMRDGGPATLVQIEPTFTALRERLSHFILAALDDAQIDEVGKQIGESAPPLTEDRERSFAWLLSLQFQEMTQRFNNILSEYGRCLLRAAQLLDTCGIPITRERWLRVAKQVLNVPIEAQADAIASLRSQGFLYQESPDPSYLRHVVNGDFDLQSTYPTLADALEQENDGEGFLYWGNSLLAKGIDPWNIVIYLQKALHILKSRGTPDDNQAAAVAAYNLGVVMDLAGDLETAKNLYLEATILVKADRTPSGQLLGALAALHVGYHLCRSGNVEEANTYYVDSLARGKTSQMAEGYMTAANAALNLAKSLDQAGNVDEANELYLTAVDLGKASGIDNGQAIAAEAALELAYRLAQSGNLEEANKQYLVAIDVGKTSGISNGQTIAAIAAFNVGMHWDRAGNKEDAIRFYHDAHSLGKSSQTAEGQAVAAEAKLSIGLNLHRTGNVQDAVRYCEDAIELGRESGTAKGLMVMAQATLNKGVISDLSSNFEEARKTYRDAIHYGRASGIPFGQACAAQAAFNLGQDFHKLGNLEAAAEYYRDALDLGEASEIDTGQKFASLAAFGLALIHKKSGNKEGASKYYSKAFDLGMASGTVEGHETAAHGALTLGINLDEIGDPEGANKHFRSAINLGRLSSTPHGKTAAAEAAFRLGLNLQIAADPDNAEKCFRDAADLGNASGTPEGLKIAALAKSHFESA